MGVDMLTRIVECHAKTGKQDELANKVRTEVLTILKRQPGFVDLIALRDNADEQRLVFLSFWNSREEAENYDRNYFDRIDTMLRPLFASNPRVEILRVDDSTVHRIAASRAA